MLQRMFHGILFSSLLTLQQTAYAFVLNNPYPSTDAKQKIEYTSFNEQPKTLDPALSYNANEFQFIGQIYEPVLQYDYLARPYRLIPLTALSMPEVRYYDNAGHELPSSLAENVAKTIYTIHIKPGIYYQPHPALAKNKQGDYEYLNLQNNYIAQHDVNQLNDFKLTGTRELVADDYVYQIKRLASPHVNSPIYGLMGDYIEGFSDYAKTLPEKGKQPRFLDLRQYPLTGVRTIDRYTYEITLKEKYAQFLYWLAMPFFSPIPWEADKFYSQVGMAENNISFGWYPIGTGAFMMTENNPNSRMVMEKNPQFRETYFPTTGTEEDKAKGYLAHAGEKLPLLDKVEFLLEKETIPRWNKFLQGYYDLSGVATDNFDQAISVSSAGGMSLTPQMKEKGMTLQEVAEPSIFYLGFNMLDPIVGGHSERARLLRQAIAIAVNYEENINIFLNGRGESVQGPIPPGIFGYSNGLKGINPYVYVWDHGQRKRRTIREARELMKAAGYPDGRDSATHRPLILHYDVTSSGNPDEKAQLNWMMKQFAKIGINLDVRATQYNRFQEKLRHGNAQIFSWGWSADYPDPENFLFLLYGPNGKVNFGGENATNYSNPRFDALFEAMKNRPDDAVRQQIIDSMIDIYRRDMPWAGGVNTKIPVLRQQWMSPVKPSSVSQNSLKFADVNIPLREQLREEWNQAILWPIIGLLGLLCLFIFPFIWAYYHQERLPVRRILHEKDQLENLP
jgi:oligopeptide transport system substrate-binding protein